MKLRRIFAAIAACAVAATMAISAYADDVVVDGLSEEDEYGHYIDMAKIYEKVADVATCEVTIKDDKANGCICVAAESTSWGWNPIQEAKDNGDGTFTYVAECALKDTDTFVKLTVQDWDTATAASLVSIVLKDASGNVLAQAPKAAADPEPTPTPTPAPGSSSDPGSSSTAPSGGSTNPGTGATAGLALAGLAIAGAAVVAAKKSK